VQALAMMDAAKEQKVTASMRGMPSLLKYLGTVLIQDALVLYDKLSFHPVFVHLAFHPKFKYASPPL